MAIQDWLYLLMNRRFTTMTTLKLTIKDWQDILDNTIEKSKSKEECANFLREFAKKFKIEFVG